MCSIMDHLSFQNVHLVRYDESNPFRQSRLHYVIHWYNDSIATDLYEFLAFVDTLIDVYPDVINKQDTFGLTALHYAVEYDYIELAHLLLRKGVSVRVKDIYGDTATDVSVRYYSRNPRHKELRRLLSLHERIAVIKSKIRFVGKLMCVYRRSIERVYAPNGTGYEQAKKHFESLLVNEFE